MKWIIGLLIATPLWFGAAIYGASEYGGETVVLETRDERESSVYTTLWVVDIHGQPWLRSGRPDAAWLQRLATNPDVFMVRSGIRTAYRAEIAVSEGDRINHAMHEKYGFAEELISLIHDEDEVVAIRLYVPDPL
jgi:hypothetical protein